MTTSTALANDDTLARDVGSLLLVGFSGHDAASESALRVASWLKSGEVAGVVFVKENVGDLDETVSLTRLFAAAPNAIIAIDHEGGAVQRLAERQGIVRLPKAFEVARSLSVDRAQALYGESGAALRRLGFTLNLGPVVDADDPECAAIGRYGRAFSGEGATIARYATAFVNGFEAAGVTCVLKHFPGVGHVVGDSHLGLPEGSSRWSPRDLEPFERMISASRAKAIMAAHVRIRSLEPRSMPVSLSRAVMTDLLRQRLRFKGAALTDDLDMQAIRLAMSRHETVLAAINAGCDLLMIRNVIDHDPALPRSVVGWVRQALSVGRLQRERIAQAAIRATSISPGSRL